MKTFPESADIWRVFFLSERVLDDQPVPRCVVRQRKTPPFRMNGAWREDGPWWLFKYTLAGMGRFSPSNRDFCVEKQENSAAQCRSPNIACPQSGISYDGVDQSLPPGTAFLCKTNDPHVVYACDPDVDHWEFVFLTFFGADNLVEQLLARHGRVFDLGKDESLVRDLLRWEDHDGDLVDVGIAQGARIVNETLLTILETVERPQSASTSHALIRQARREIHRNLEAPYSVQQLAADLRVSRNHLARVFQSSLGITPVAYLLREKMKHAAYFLHETTLSVKEIAHILGYDNPSNFTRSFKQVMGRTPGQTRR